MQSAKMSSPGFVKSAKLLPYSAAKLYIGIKEICDFLPQISPEASLIFTLWLLDTIG